MSARSRGRGLALPFSVAPSAGLARDTYTVGNIPLVPVVAQVEFPVRGALRAEA
jgi:hypothetical protein